MLVDKKRPCIFIFDLIQNTLNKVEGISDNIKPTYPLFDETSRGIIFSGTDCPNKKFGLIYCTNRPTALYHIAEPIFDKKNEEIKLESYMN